tara:strand:- start:2180 stop:2527 length:348 start_codon:yes stop_codon:yes gene_type:complete
MSNSIPQYTQVRNCTLPPGDLYKINKFGDKSSSSRLSSIKACVNKNSTANSFKGSGMGGSAAGFSQVQTSGGRTNKLSSLVSRHSKNEKKRFETQRLSDEREKVKEKKRKNKKKK